MKIAIRLLGAILFVMLMACSSGNGSDLNDSGGEVNDDSQTEEPWVIENALYINIISAETVASFNPATQENESRTEIGLEIGNPTDDTIEYDEVRVTFRDGLTFVTGTRAADTEDSVLLEFWYEDEELPDFSQPTIPVTLPPKMVRDYLVLTGGTFILDARPQYIHITVHSDGKPIANATFEH